jgi:hypothetical protein
MADITDTQIETMRGALRISFADYDTEIKQYMKAAMAELARVDANAQDLNAPLVWTAVELFCKYMFNFEGDGEKYKLRFNDLRDVLSLSLDYRSTADD